MMISKAEISEIIRESVDEFEQSFSKKISANNSLYGESGALDSLGLVQFLSILEQNLEDKTGEVVTIASEKAMSQRNSPFRSIESLTEYLAEHFSGNEHG